MTPKEKAKELVKKFDELLPCEGTTTGNTPVECALIAIENEYHSLREQLFNLRLCGVIESEKVYLHKIQELIDEEKEVKQEILGL